MILIFKQWFEMYILARVGKKSANLHLQAILHYHLHGALESVGIARFSQQIM